MRQTWPRQSLFWVDDHWCLTRLWTRRPHPHSQADLSLVHACINLHPVQWCCSHTVSRAVPTSKRVLCLCSSLRVLASCFFYFNFFHWCEVTTRLCGFQELSIQVKRRLWPRLCPLVTAQVPSVSGGNMMKCFVKLPSSLSVLVDMMAKKEKTNRESVY